MQSYVSGLMIIVSVLPTAPLFNGQLCLYQTAAMETAGVPPWLLRYRSLNGDGTPNANTNKWEPLGAPVPLWNEVTTAETTASTTYAALTTPGPSITIPLDGVYDVIVGDRAYTSGAAGSRVLHSYDIGGTAAVDADAAYHDQAVANTDSEMQERPRRKTALVAGTVLLSKYRVTAGTANFAERWIRGTPVRVG